MSLCESVNFNIMNMSILKKAIRADKQGIHPGNAPLLSTICHTGSQTHKLQGGGNDWSSPAPPPPAPLVLISGGRGIYVIFGVNSWL